MIGAPRPGAQAVHRALKVLKAFDAEHPQWTVSDLARHVGLHKTTAFRLLGALVKEGMLDRDERTGIYRLGSELIALATQALRSTDLYLAAHAELEALARDTGETSTLEILVGHETVMLDEVHGRYLVGSRPDFGLRFPAHATSTGKVLLAAMMQTGAALPGRRRTLERLAPKTITSWTRLERELAVVARLGFATTSEEIEVGYSAVSAPVLNAEGRTVAAVSVGGATVRFTPKEVARLARRVTQSARVISRRLGATTPEAPAGASRRSSGATGRRRVRNAG